MYWGGWVVHDRLGALVKFTIRERAGSYLVARADLRVTTAPRGRAADLALS